MVLELLTEGQVACWPSILTKRAMVDPRRLPRAESAPDPGPLAAAAIIAIRSREGEDVTRQCRRVAVHGENVEYESCLGTGYLSLGYHRSKAPKKHPKALWAIPRADECHTFCTSEGHGWSDDNGDCWAVAMDARRELGRNGERVAFFPEPTNDHDPWHGYPVSGRRSAPNRRRPPDGVVNQWYQEGWITFTTHARLIGGRL